MGRELTRLLVCRKNFISVLTMAAYKIYFRHQFHFSFNSYKSVANANSKQPLQLDWDNSMDCDRGNPEYKFYDNIGDLSVRSFWYHSNDTKRNPWVMLCSHCPINDSSGYLHTTVYLAVMLQASWHTAEGNWESKGSYIKSWWIEKISQYQIYLT